MATEKTLNDAFYEALKDVYFAERTSVRALKKAAKAAKGPELKQALEQHADESAEQVERLQQVFEILGKAARGKTCEAIQGLFAEMEEHLEEFKEIEASMRFSSAAPRPWSTTKLPAMACSSHGLSSLACRMR